jgi:hypothetical protein
MWRTCWIVKVLTLILARVSSGHIPIAAHVGVDRILECVIHKVASTDQVLVIDDAERVNGRDGRRRKVGDRWSV